MLVSEPHSFAFVHVPKTAGSSVNAALARYATTPDAYWANRWLARVGIPVNRFAPWPHTKFRTHAPADVLRAWLPPDVFAGLFKFAFVRNPWDLLVSSWNYIIRTPAHGRHKLVTSLPSFAGYVEYEIRRGGLSQSQMLCDRDGRVLVDFVGRYESLASDFDFICRRIGVEATLPRANAGSHGDYRDYYSPALLARVAEAFEADIERFGYTFEEGVSRGEEQHRRAA
jgi:hypothetical protein